MTETKFTEGPWEALKPGDPSDHASVVAATGLYVVFTYGVHDYKNADVERANAHLIAAAPDLYALVFRAARGWDAIADEYERDGMSSSAAASRSEAANCRAALSKARGEAAQ